MIALLFVADGPRDEAVVPPLVEGMLGVPVSSEFRAWKSLRLNARMPVRGFARKLAFATRVARDAGLPGLVATVDTDTADRGHRLRWLKEGVAADRLRSPPLPTAVGEATPHAEAWLLDDPVAVRRVLELDAAIAIPTIRHVKSPKDALRHLMESSPRPGIEVLGILVELARMVEAHRCVHADESGFRAFADEVRRELSPLAV